MMKFFANDFTQERWRRAGLKNAFALLSKQRFEHAAAFFLLVGQLWDAVEVCNSRLHDLQLALVITRLYEGDNGPTYNKLLKESILGMGLHNAQPSSDPFLRSMSLWLLQDFSGALETLVVDLKPGLENSSKSSNTAIFNFYFYLRSHPLLIRRVHPVKEGHSIHPSASVMNFSAKFHGQTLSGVGDEPLTPTERNLVFTTAYHHLNSGSPLLALTVLSKLPKMEDLGLTDEPQLQQGGHDSLSCPQRTLSFDAVMSGLIVGDTRSSPGGKNSRPVAFQIGDEPNSSLGGGTKHLGAIQEEENLDWSQPVSLQTGVQEDENGFDWSKPVSGQLAADDDDGFDWSKPVSSQLHLSDNKEDKVADKQVDETKTAAEAEKDQKEEEESRGKATTPISPRGLFIISLAEQLQYNALLSLLTEELATIHIPSCCMYLWQSRGKEALPLLPLKHDSSQISSMVEWFEDESLECILTSLQATLVEWLRKETRIVKEVCGIEISDGSGHCLISAKQASHAGYDLLTTLLNYVSLHAGTLPSMLALKTELMHLMNTLLPWSTGLSPEMEDADADAEVGQMALCAVSPVQLPLLTSCSLPAKHPLNLALHLKLLSASIFQNISNHSSPPNIFSPLLQMNRVFELCVSLSHCICLCLTPMRLQRKEFHESGRLSSSSTSTKRQRTESGSEQLDFISSLDNPKSRPAKWPGLAHWPNSLLSDDGKEASPLCLVLMEAMVVLYTGLLAVAWSKHSTYDLLVLLANIPTQNTWSDLFGGGITEQKKSASVIHNYVKKVLRSEKKETGGHGLYVAPKKSLLKHCLTKVNHMHSTLYVYMCN